MMPWAIGDLMVFNKFPFHLGATLDIEVVPYRRANVDASGLVDVIFRFGITKHILPVIRFKRSDILPLGVANAAMGVDGNPATFTDRNAVATIMIPEPRDDILSF